MTRALEGLSEEADDGNAECSRGGTRVPSIRVHRNQWLPTVSTRGSANILGVTWKTLDQMMLIENLQSQFLMGRQKDG